MEPTCAVTFVNHDYLSLKSKNLNVQENNRVSSIKTNPVLSFKYKYPLVRKVGTLLDTSQNVIEEAQEATEAIEIGKREDVAWVTDRQTTVTESADNDSREIDDRIRETAEDTGIGYRKAQTVVTNEETIDPVIGCRNAQAGFTKEYVLKRDKCRATEDMAVDYRVPNKVTQRKLAQTNDGPSVNRLLQSEFLDTDVFQQLHNEKEADYRDIKSYFRDVEFREASFNCLSHLVPNAGIFKTFAEQGFYATGNTDNVSCCECTTLMKLKPVDVFCRNKNKHQAKCSYKS